MSMNVRNAAGLLLLAACHQGTILADERPAPPRETALRADAGLAPPLARVDAGATSAPATPFAVVARAGDAAAPFLVRPSSGPIVVALNDARALWQAEEAGTLRLVTSFVEHVSPNEPEYMRIASVAGRWPSLHVAMAYTGGRGGASIHNWVVDVAKNTAKRAPGISSHVATSSPWLEGTELGWVPQFPEAPGSGKFVLLEGPKKPLPRVPKALWGGTGALAAYSSGRIFLGAGTMVADAQSEAALWTWAGAEAQSTVMPGMITDVVRGRREEETLVTGVRDAGGTYVVRFDGASWVDVPIPTDLHLRKVVIGDDGSVWMLTRGESVKPKRGAPPPANLRAPELWRGSFPALQMTRVPLPEGVAIDDIALTTEKDVWLSGTRGPRGKTENVILHAQPHAPEVPLDLSLSPDDLARIVYGEREPAAFAAGCNVPFVVLGRAEGVPFSEAAAFEASWNEPSPEARAVAVTVRTPSKDHLVGLELGGAWLYGSRPADVKESASIEKALAAAQKKWPAAKLVCTRLSLVGGK